MRIHPSFVLLGALTLACGDKTRREEAITGPVPSTSAVRFFNYGVNAPSVQFYANDRKLTATTSASCQSASNPPITATDSTCVTIGIQATTGVSYATGVAAGGLYTAIDPGQYTITGRTVSSSSSGDAVSTLPATIAPGKFYSYYQSGFYNSTTKTVDAFLVEDPLPATIDWSTAQVRFVNAIGNSQPMTLYAVNTQSAAQTALGGAVAYKAAGSFTALTPFTYDLHAKTADGTDRIVRTFVAFLPGHVYTITAHGDMTVTSTTSANRPILDSSANQ